MTLTTNWKQLQEDHELAYFRGELATSSPESYTIDEMKTISEGMEASTKQVEAAMRDDFTSMTPSDQARMLELLQKADPDGFHWWLETLVGETPDAPPAA